MGWRAASSKFVRYASPEDALYAGWDPSECHSSCDPRSLFLLSLGTGSFRVLVGYPEKDLVQFQENEMPQDDGFTTYLPFPLSLSVSIHVILAS